MKRFTYLLTPMIIGVQWGITHDHHDHLSLTDIAKIAGPETRFVIVNAGREKIEQSGYKHIQTISPGAAIMINDLRIMAVPAYNLIKPMHPKNEACHSPHRKMKTE